MRSRRSHLLPDQFIIKITKKLSLQRFSKGLIRWEDECHLPTTCEDKSIPSLKNYIVRPGCFQVLKYLLHWSLWQTETGDNPFLRLTEVRHWWWRWPTSQSYWCPHTRGGLAKHTSHQEAQLKTLVNMLHQATTPKILSIKWRNLFTHPVPLKPLTIIFFYEKIE